MLILFLKATAADVDEPLPLPEKLRLIFTARVKDAKTEEDRDRAKRDLQKFKSSKVDPCSS